MVKDIKRMRNERGFTLIELLVVIVILGILAAVVVFAVGGLTDKGEGSSCKIDTRTLRTAQEAHSAKAGNSNLYGANDAALVTQKLLAEESSLHETVGSAAVAATNGPDGVPGGGDDTPAIPANASYKIYVTDSKCGTPDTDGATGGWDAAAEVTPGGTNR